MVYTPSICPVNICTALNMPFCVVFSLRVNFLPATTVYCFRSHETKGRAVWFGDKAQERFHGTIESIGRRSPGPICEYVFA